MFELVFSDFNINFEFIKKKALQYEFFRACLYPKSREKVCSFEKWDKPLGRNIQNPELNYNNTKLLFRGLCGFWWCVFYTRKTSVCIFSNWFSKCTSLCCTHTTHTPFFLTQLLAFILFARFRVVSAKTDKIEWVECQLRRYVAPWGTNVTYNLKIPPKKRHRKAHRKHSKFERE